jgi:predicted DNA-binding protein
MERSGNALDSEIKEISWHKNGYEFSVVTSTSLLNRFCVEKLKFLHYCEAIEKQEILMEQKKHPRSIRMDYEVNRKLEAVCKALGTNANSYILNELGKAIIRDYQSIHVQETNDKASEGLSQMFAAILDENEKLKDLSNG